MPSSRRAGPVERLCNLTRQLRFWKHHIRVSASAAIFSSLQITPLASYAYPSRPDPETNTDNELVDRDGADSRERRSLAALSRGEKNRMDAYHRTGTRNDNRVEGLSDS